jgi:hypothetical protein
MNDNFPPSLSGRRWLSPLVVGLAIGILFASLNWGGGYDAYTVFFSGKLQTVPPWAHLVLIPLSWLPWPYSYGIMCVLTVLITAWVAEEFGTKGWIILLSMPLFWELWSGQIEWLVILGLLLGMWVLERRIHPFWLGLALLLVLIKPWTGWGPALVLTLFALRELGWRKLLPAVGSAGLVLLCTFIFWPGWIQEWLLPMFQNAFVLFSGWIQKLGVQNLNSGSGQALGGENNGAFPWPWGLLAWFFVPGARDQKGWLRRVTAATLLTSAYLRFYHVLILLVLLDDIWESWFAFISGWVILLLGVMGLNWGTLAWTIPAGVLLIDQKQCASAWRFYKAVWDGRVNRKYWIFSPRL